MSTKRVEKEYPANVDFEVVRKGEALRYELERGYRDHAKVRVRLQKLYAELDKAQRRTGRLDARIASLEGERKALEAQDNYYMQNLPDLGAECRYLASQYDSDGVHKGDASNDGIGLEI